jgi:hypothetical protein
MDHSEGGRSLQKAAACVAWGPDGIVSIDRLRGNPYGEKARTIEEARVECEKALPIARRSGFSRADLEKIHDPTIGRIYYMCPDQKMIVHIIPEQFEEGLFNRTYQQLPGGKLLKGGFLGPPPPP